MKNQILDENEVLYVDASGLPIRRRALIVALMRKAYKRRKTDDFHITGKAFSNLANTKFED